MFTSIRGKILSLLVVLALLAVGVATWLHINSSLTSRRSELQERAKDIGDFIGLTFTDELLTDVPVPLEKRKKMRAWLDSKSHVNFFSVYNTSGERIFAYRSSGETLPGSPRLNSRYVRRTMNSDLPLLSRAIPRLEAYDFLVPVRLFEVQFGLVRLGFNAERFHADRNRIIRQNAVFGLLVLLAVTGLGWLVTRYIVKPIKHLESAARRFGRGELTTRADVQSGDEVQRLGEQFNTMAGRIEQQIEDLRTIEELNRKISARLRPEKLYDRIVNLVSNTWDIPHIVLILHNPRTGSHTLAAGYQVSESVEDELSEMIEPVRTLTRLTDEREDRTESNRRKVLQSLKPMFEGDGETPLTDGFAFELEKKSEDDGVGYLVLAHRGETFDESQVNLLQTLTHQINIAVRNANNYERAVTDDLTGLYTRRFFEMELEEEMENHGAGGGELSLIMIDIDDFKEYNDTHGHPAGDEVLKRVAEVFRSEVRSSDLREASRQTDTVARYGGEEFSIILPSTDGDSARKVGQRIVERVESLDDFERTVTISLGVTKYTTGESRKDFVERADDALYHAKNNGKNQVHYREPE